MQIKTVCVLITLLGNAVACAQSPSSGVYRIYEYCRKEKTDPTVVALIKKLGLEDAGGGGEYYKYYQPGLSTDYKLISMRINPQPTLSDIQGFSIHWKKPGLTYEEIQQLVGLSLPPRGSKEIHSSEDGSESRYSLLEYKYSNGLPTLDEVAILCTKNSYDTCTQIDIHCFPFVHPD
ncbi:MAG: hypothetical protein HY080_07635 [Gammaproteobacteria bacterium]|nr:hypothetical protein [Gammaproteobacteria bacterium]